MAAELNVPEWEAKLVGKKIVSEVTDPSTEVAESDITVEKYRIVGPDASVTMDHVPERLNIHVSEDKTVTQVKAG